MDVAALVRELHAESVTVTLVNLSVRDRHDVIVGAGSFAEHCFTHAGVVEQDNRGGPRETRTPVDGPWFRLRLPPGTEITLELGMRRYAQQPGYAFPWHGGVIPVR
jgi:hypothetical protein